MNTTTKPHAETPFDEKASLELITRMIRNTQSHMEGNEGIPSLVWGYVTLAVTAAVWSTIHFTGNDYWHFLWFAIPVLGLILTRLFKKRLPHTVRTYVDKTISYVWMVMGSACLVLSACSFVVSMNILFVVLLLIGAATTITGLIVHYIPVTLGGIVSMVLSIVLLFSHTLDSYLLIFAIAFIAMCIIPGHCLNYKARKTARSQEVSHV